jgi:hypothetical protein
MKTKLTYLADHDTRLIYLNGSQKDIELDHLLLFNHGATDEELEWIFEDRACFYTNEKKLLSGLTSIFFHRLIDNAKESNCLKGVKGGAMAYAPELAKMEIAKMEKESAKPIYVAINRPYKDLETFGMGTISTPNEKSFANGE